MTSTCLPLPGSYSEKEVRNLFGDPADDPIEYEQKNIVSVAFPFECYAAWDVKTRVRAARVHRAVAESLQDVLADIWARCAYNQKLIVACGMQMYGGGFVVRQKRSGVGLSMHAYGLAVDFDPIRNPMGGKPNFLKHPHVVDAFKSAGWVWGGDFSRPDGMHFQAARLS